MNRQKIALKQTNLRHRFLIFGLLIYCIYLPFNIAGDGAVRFLYVLQSIDQGKLLQNMVYPLVGPMFSLPLYLPGIIFNSQELIISLVFRYNLFLFAAAITFLYKHLKPYLDINTLHIFLVILSFGSFIPRYLANYYGEVFTAVFVAVGVVLLATTHKPKYWPFIMLGVLNQPATFLGFFLLNIVWCFNHKKYHYLLLIPIQAALIVTESWYRLGQNPFNINFGYSGVTSLSNIMPFSGTTGFSYPLVYGLLGNLFSFGKGLIFFAPGLLLHPPKKTPTSVQKTIQYWQIFLLGAILVYSKWSAWSGGYTWGPRFLILAAFPSSLLLALNLSHPSTFKKALIIASLTIFSFWVSFAGLSYRLDPVCEDNRYQHDYLCWFTPEFSPIFQPLTKPQPLSSRDQVLGILILSATISVFLPSLNNIRTKKITRIP